MKSGRLVRRTCSVGVVVLAWGTIAGCGAPPSREDSATVTPSVPLRLGVDGAASSGVSVAADGDRAIVTWASTMGDRTDVYAAASRDGGRTFGTPIRVNDVDGDARVTGEQAPRVAMGRDVVVAWVSKVGGQSRIRMARSIDGARSFLPAVTLHREDLTGARGWPSVTVDAGGTVHVAWLDGRDAHMDHAAKVPAAGGAGAETHAMHESMRQDVFQAAWRPDGAPIETTVSTNVCFCCKTAIAAGPDGSTYVAWRHIYPTNLRDMAVARSMDGGRTFGRPTRVSEDHWQLDGCPEDGPSIAVDTAGVVHVAWPTIIDGPEPRKAVFYAFSADGGQSFSPRLRIDADDAAHVAAHPQLSLIDGGLALVWDESDAGQRRVRMRTVTSPSDAWSPQLGPVTTVSADAPAVYPAVAAVSRGVLVAWTHTTASGSEIRVRRVDRRE